MTRYLHAKKRNERNLPGRSTSCKSKSRKTTTVRDDPASQPSKEIVIVDNDITCKSGEEKADDSLKTIDEEFIEETLKLDHSYCKIREFDEDSRLLHDMPTIDFELTESVQFQTDKNEKSSRTETCSLEQNSIQGIFITKNVFRKLLLKIKISNLWSKVVANL